MAQRPARPPPENESADATYGRRQPEREYLYWEHREGGYDQAVRFGKWKAVRRDGGPTQLYDVQRDWRERLDLAAERPELVATAERLMAEAVT